MYKLGNNPQLGCRVVTGRQGKDKRTITLPSARLNSAGSHKSKA